eukprot:CAMPEP_0172932744 /NCGR_PEP_ID=MMETSP1075-20121228/220153_1 /TAXON_ID=2916 /ORGANISM="Ceratium fusus, Strain PA161109" /LENGTH=144 /DNA_ID=CAMNT_0013794077 /DNA_START=155 /DNA_END=589 /DNA_ORIENTATION=-
MDGEWIHGVENIDERGCLPVCEECCPITVLLSLYKYCAASLTNSPQQCHVNTGQLSRIGSRSYVETSNVTWLSPGLRGVLSNHRPSQSVRVLRCIAHKEPTRVPRQHRATFGNWLQVLRRDQQRHLEQPPQVPQFVSGAFGLKA